MALETKEVDKNLHQNQITVFGFNLDPKRPIQDQIGSNDCDMCP